MFNVYIMNQNILNTISNKSNLILYKFSLEGNNLSTVEWTPEKIKLLLKIIYTNIKNEEDVCTYNDLYDYITNEINSIIKLNILNNLLKKKYVYNYYQLICVYILNKIAINQKNPLYFTACEMLWNKNKNSYSHIGKELLENIANDYNNINCLRAIKLLYYNEDYFIKIIDVLNSNNCHSLNIYKILLHNKNYKAEYTTKLQQMLIDYNSNLRDDKFIMNAVQLLYVNTPVYKKRNLIKETLINLSKNINNPMLLDILKYLDCYQLNEYKHNVYFELYKNPDNKFYIDGLLYIWSLYNQDNELYKEYYDTIINHFYKILNDPENTYFNLIFEKYPLSKFKVHLHSVLITCQFPSCA